jgi:hypothetical protein
MVVSSNMDFWWTQKSYIGLPTIHYLYDSTQKLILEWLDSVIPLRWLLQSSSEIDFGDPSHPSSTIPHIYWLEEKIGIAIILVV